MKQFESKSSVEYAKNIARKLVQQFKETSIRYEYNEDIGQHFIEVSPKEFMENKPSSFVKFANDEILGFIQKFPLESIAFIPTCSLYELENSTLELFGYLFKNNLN